MPEPRWLDDTEMCAWRGLLVFHEETMAEIERRLRGYGVNGVEYGILAYLSDQPGQRMRMSALAEVAFVSLSRLSHRLDRLEELGYVSRRSCADDQRSTEAELTARGRSFLEDAAPRHLADVRELIFDHLAPAQTKALADAVVAIAGRDPTSTLPASAPARR